MTVCIAAICEFGPNPIVIGASDRMLTASDIQFQPPQSKIYPIGDSIAIMIAGNSAVQAEVCIRTQEQGAVSVRQAVQRYCRNLGKYFKRQGERELLYPYDLTWQTFLENQNRLPPDFVDRVIHDFRQQRHKFDEETETIICGVDNHVAHLYKVDRHGRAHCHDATGFVAIGEGEWHAQSQFMVYEYSRNWNFTNALHLTYWAKRRAEVAPTVGPDTDLFYIANGFVALPPELTLAVETSYEEMISDQSQAVHKSAGALYSAVAEFLAKQRPPIAEGQQSSGPPEQTVPSENADPQETNHGDA